MTKQEKKKALVEWLNSPITIAYYKRFEENKEELEKELIYTARTDFVGGQTKKRSPTEIEHQINLVAIDLNLRIFVPLFEFKKWCAEQNIDMIDIPETYEREEIGIEEKSQYPNPLDLFINEL